MPVKPPRSNKSEYKYERVSFMLEGKQKQYRKQQIVDMFKLGNVWRNDNFVFVPEEWYTYAPAQAV